MPAARGQRNVSSKARAVNARGSSKPTPAIVVGPNVQVSKAFAGKPHNETHLATNPRDPLNLLGGSMVWQQETNTQTVIAYASFDGGETWSPTLELKDGRFHTDPAAAFDAQGNAYFLQITHVSGEGETKYYTYVHRSKDGGRSWLEPTIIPMMDRHYLAIDDNPGKYQGTLYINGVSFRKVSIQRSTDRGATFVGEVQAATAPSGRRNAGLAPLVVLTDGTLVVPFMDAEAVPDPDMEGSPSKTNAILKVITSNDGAITFSEPVTITQIALGHGLTSNAHHFSLATDRTAGPFKDRLYVTWADSYSRGGQFSAKKAGGSNILLSYSTDKGKSWSKPIILNDDPPLSWVDAPVHFQPVAAVNKDGVVGVMYYDRRDSANNLDWTVRFTASLDGGETFLPSVQVAESPNRHASSAKVILGARGYGGGHMPPNKNYRGGALKFDLSISQFNLSGGHTAGMDADANGAFHPFWVDNRTGVAQVWTAPVTINRKAIRNGDPQLATLQDVSEKVIVKYTNPTYDTRTGRLSVDVQLQNTSTDTILLPLKLRVVALATAGLGVPTIVGADNGMDGVGAVWDLEKILVDQKLKPKEKSRVRRLEFRIAQTAPLTEAAIRMRGWGALELVHVEARLLANIQQNAPATQK
ncbi:MAG TPA: sialidase family protein [Pyrinomonadaceae bacterium]|nr:sialidase family protein [Pyrinomonadaceae bacterium]